MEMESYKLPDGSVKWFVAVYYLNGAQVDLDAIYNKGFENFDLHVMTLKGVRYYYYTTKKV